jgi:hypothetical protein
LVVGVENSGIKDKNHEGTKTLRITKRLNGTYPDSSIGILQIANIKVE